MIVESPIINNRLLRIVIIIFPFVFFAFTELLGAFYWDSYVKFTIEDGVIENSQAVTLFLSFLLASSITINFYRKHRLVLAFIYCAVSIILIFICLEEISWGQRIFGFASPKYFQKYNVQNETNLHNIDLFHIKWNFFYFLLAILVILYCGLTWCLLPAKTAIKYKKSIHFIMPGYDLCAYFILPSFYWLVLTPSLWWRDVLHPGRVAEVVELMSYIGILLFMIMGKIRQNRDMNPNPNESEL